MTINQAKYYLIFFVFLTIGFQQVLVIRVGGSLKLYEIASLLLIPLIFYQWKPISKEFFYALVFFVISPFLSLSFYYLSYEGFPNYYSEFPYATSIRYDTLLAPLIIFVYFIINAVFILAVINCKKIRQNKDTLIRFTVFVASFIAIYGLYAAYFSGVLGWADPIKMLPDFLENKADQSEYGFRVSGFSQEPGFYVLFQSWIVLFLFFSQKTFSSVERKTLFFLNFMALIFTLSSSLLAFFLSVTISVFLFSSIYRKIIFTGVLLIIFVVSLVIINSLGFLDLVEYVFFGKIINFFSVPTHTLDSGSFRAFTGILGLEIFKDNFWLGVGPGCSNFYMNLYENKMDIVSYGETLKPGSFPQNTYSKVLAEQGVFGFVFLLLFLFSSLLKFYKLAKEFTLMRVFFIGTLMTLIMLLSISPQYSLFLWAFIGLGLAIRKGGNIENNYRF